MCVCACGCMSVGVGVGAWGEKGARGGTSNAIRNR